MRDPSHLRARTANAVILVRSRCPEGELEAMHPRPWMDTAPTHLLRELAVVLEAQAISLKAGD